MISKRTCTSWWPVWLVILVVLVVWHAIAVSGACVDPVRPGLTGTEPRDTAKSLRLLDANVLADGESLADMLADDVQARLSEANRRELAAWRAVRTREDWERLKDSRSAALRQSLGAFEPEARPLNVRTAGVLEGHGYRIEKLLFESRDDLWVTANLYVPSDAPESMPGILICHSHHHPKTQGELQDMGVMWARQGCLVLVMDQLGHGERRQHPFRTAADYGADFRVGRQDYYFRYNVGMQLHLAGESLMGWMTRDLVRGVDLLLSRRGIDRQRIILLGAVAGGGDPAAVAAALDARIACAVPFNFGGPQPENRYPLPDDAEDSFNYVGDGSWESTRNLRLSARDGFLPWVIVGSIGPRRLIYAHEFSWDREGDPVWKQLQAIYAFYDASDNLAFAHGFGRLSGQPPDASHCNNIGPAHRKMIHAALEGWFGIPVPNEEETERHSAEELLCATDVPEIGLTPLHRLLDDKTRAAWNDELPGTSPPELRAVWSTNLGDIEPYLIAEIESRGDDKTGNIRLQRLLLHGERNIRLPVLLLMPQRPNAENLPLVIAVSQEGKAGFLDQRTEWLAALLDGGAAVCLPDLRGTGESRPGSGRGRQSEATSLSASELMLGQTAVGMRLKDLRSLLAWLRERPEFDARLMAVCGDSFAPVNPTKANVEVPLDLDQPHLAEPLGSLLALLCGLFEDDLTAVSAYGGLIGFRSVLQSQFVHVPHDAIVPGALQAGDLSAMTAALAPRPLWLGGFVDGLNRRVSDETSRHVYPPASNRAVAGQEADPDEVLASWLLEALRDQ